jgi:glycosyltransferase involved in cell wall biosynthesis
LEAVRKLVAAARAGKPDAIGGWMYHGAIAALLLRAVRPSAQVFWSIHHTLDRWEEEKPSTRRLVKLLGWLQPMAHRVQFCSASSAKSHALHGFSSSKAEVIYNGFDVERFTPGAGPLPSAGRRRVVGHVARFHPMKDHANFLAAAGALAARRADVDFMMAGAGVTEGNGTLRELVARHGLGGRVRLLGARRDLPALMARLDVLAVSSAWGEAFPIVIGEAMSCGTPCVSTDVGDARLMIGDTGAVVPTRDPQALAAAIDTILEEPEPASEARRRRCRERITDGFSLDAAADQFMALAAGAPKGARELLHQPAPRGA